MKLFWNTYKKWIIGALVLAVLWFFFGRNGNDNATKIETITIAPKTVEEVVSVTGKVKPAQEVNLSFERGGVVRSVNAEVDQVVNRGAVLATISNGDAQGRLLEAQAGLDSAQATLDQLRRGARDEEKRLKETALESAKQDLANGYSVLPDTLRNAYANASDAVRVRLSPLFDGRSGSSYKLTFTPCDFQTETDVVNLRLQADEALRVLQTTIDTIDTANIALADATLANATRQVNVIDGFIRRTNDLLSVSCALANRDFDQYRAAVTAARTPLNAALSELSTRRNAIASLKLNVTRAENDLALTLAGTDVDRIRAQEAVVKQAQARVTQAYSDISQTVITAPFTGRIIKVDAKRGQYAAPSQALITMISDSAFQIEARVPEVDIKRVSKNNPAIVWIDAFGKEVLFDAVVLKIDPAATIADGVPTYMTTFAFVKKDERVRSGMTANIDLITSIKENAFAIPARALQRNNNGSFVRVKRGEGIIEVPVRVGIRGRNGEVEIISGLVGGEEVVVSDVK